MTRLTKIEKEIREYTERNHDNLIPASCMRRVVREILSSHGEGLRMTKDAQSMIQMEAESMLTQKFSRAMKIANIAKRDTISPEDMKMVDEISH
jgi:histone H3/H4